MKRKPIFILLILFVCALVWLSPNSVKAADGIRTKEEAVQWIVDRKNEAWAEDYDSFADLPQCVDLIRYYIDWLVGYNYNIRGYGKDYAYKEGFLPEGWAYSSEPAAGDIAVWDSNVGFASSYGHVALVESVDLNNWAFNYVDVNGNTGRAGSGYISVSDCSTFIRPYFQHSGNTPTPQPAQYTVSYNANGGSGAPADQIKTHDQTLRLSTQIPTRDKYTFVGWGTSASGGEIYQAGGSYHQNANLTLYAQWEISVNETNFPDANFRAYIQKRFGESLSEGELGTTNIYVNVMNISSLKGIEFFAALEDLSCGSNQLTSLDVSHNPALVVLECNENQLTSLDVRGCTALYYLSCYRNQLTSLDVSQNPALGYLDCHFNQLTSLDVSQNPALEGLLCVGNQLTSLDVNQNPALERLDCSSNQLTSLDVSQNPALKELSCSANPLTSLNVSQNTALERLYCGSNQLTSLDVSQNPALKTLSCGSNQLTSLDVSQNPALEYLDCYRNQLTSLDVSQNPALDYLVCSSNQLTSLDVSKNLVLERLDCESNHLTSLDVSQNPALERLDCRKNQLTSLDVSQNPALERLDCRKNQLTSLDLSHNSDLKDSTLISTQSIQCSGSIPGQTDLTSIVGQENLKWVVSVEGGSYDSATGIVSLETEFTYYYDTQNEAAGNMEVHVTVIPQEVIPPEEDALKEAADIQDPATDVEMDVDKQEGEVTDQEKDQLADAIGESSGFEIVSLFDITVYSFKKDAEGKEIPGSREAITQLKSAVTLTFVTPNETGVKYQVVRVHINARGEVEVTLLPTTDNGDGTVSVESDRFSMYYLAAVDDKAYKPGDINGDGKVNIFDVIRLLKKVTGEKVETFANTDVNHDGKVNIFDVIRLLKYVTGEQVEVH